MNQRSLLIKSWLLLFMSVILAVMGPTQIYAQDVAFDVDSIDVRVEISPEGTALIQDTYVYDVDFFNGARIQIDTQGVDMLGYQVGEIKDNGEKVEYTENHSQEPGTYSVQVDDNQLWTFTIHRPTEDDQVKFYITYQIDRAVTNYTDTAEFNGQLVGNGTDDTIDVTGTIRLPGRVENPDQFRAWAHGAPQGTIELQQDGSYSLVTFNVPKNPPNQSVQVRTLFPVSLTPNNPNQVDRPQFDAIISEEEAIVQADQQAYQSNQQVNIGVFLASIVVGPLLAVLALIYYFYGRKKANPDPAYVPEHLYTLPEPLTPAVMATTVLRTSPIADDFSATILDLARKGFIFIEEVKKQRRGLFKRGQDATLRIKINPNPPLDQKLMPHEQIVLKYLAPTEEEENSVSLFQIQEKIKHDPTYRADQNDLWTRFKHNTEIQGERQRGGLSVYHKRFMVLLVVAGLAALVWPVVALIFRENIYSNWGQVPIWPMAIIGYTCFALALIFAIRRPIYTYEYDKKVREWQAFKQMLEDIGNMNMREIASLPLWEEYLVYAVSLGVADKVLEAMNQQYGEEEFDQLYLPTNMYINHYLMTQVLANSVNESIGHSQSLTDQQNYHGNNSGGFGGGFSSGSTGGFGGGGGAGGF